MPQEVEVDERMVEVLEVLWYYGEGLLNAKEAQLKLVGLGVYCAVLFDPPESPIAQY